MLTEETKKDIKELATILTKLDNAGRTIMMSNAMVLLARQEISEHKEKEDGNLLIEELELKDLEKGEGESIWTTLT